MIFGDERCDEIISCMAAAASTTTTINPQVTHLMVCNSSWHHPGNPKLDLQALFVLIKPPSFT